MHELWRDKRLLMRFDRKRFSRKGKESAVGHGLTILYVGDGKGKTTAAVGLAVRALGAGLRVCFVQFMKSEKWQSYERKTLKKLGVSVHVLGAGFVGIIDDTRSLAEHRRNAMAALRTTRQWLRSGRYDVVVADEAASAVDERLLTVKELVGLIAAKPKRAHLVITGHTKHPALVAAADLATNMENIKHPYRDKGWLAQRGIDY